MNLIVRQSFQRTQAIIEKTKEHINFEFIAKLLVGIKCDLEEEKQVDFSSAKVGLDV